MKAVIYQYWEGNLTEANNVGQRLMKEYADAIGVDHIFEHNPSWPREARLSRAGLGSYQPHFGAFKPIFDSAFDNYDYILFADTDVIPVKHSRSRPRRNIFGEFLGLRQSQVENNETLTDLWIAAEKDQPEIRTQTSIGAINNANDNKWCDLIFKAYGAIMPRDQHKRPMVYNSGVVMYSARARSIFQEKMPDFKEYNNLVRQHGLHPFYGCDQPYLHAMMEACGVNWAQMPYKWNSQIYYKPGTSGDNRPISDYRQEDTQFVHVQLRGADNYSEEELLRVVND